MRRLVPETLGRSVFRRFHRIQKHHLLEQRSPQQGYARSANPLVWQARQDAPQPAGLEYLRRRQNGEAPPFLPEDASQEEFSADSPEPAARKETQLVPQPEPKHPEEKPVRIQGKRGVPVKGSVVEMGPQITQKSQTPDASEPAEAIAGKVDPAESYPEKPVRRKVQKNDPVEKPGSSSAAGQDAAIKGRQSGEAKAVRRKAHKTAPVDKPAVSKMAEPQAPAPVNRKSEPKPAAQHKPATAKQKMRASPEEPPVVQGKPLMPKIQPLEARDKLVERKEKPAPAQRESPAPQGKMQAPKLTKRIGKKAGPKNAQRTPDALPGKPFSRPEDKPRDAEQKPATVQQKPPVVPAPAPAQAKPASATVVRRKSVEKIPKPEQFSEQKRKSIMPAKPVQAGKKEAAARSPSSHAQAAAELPRTEKAEQPVLPEAKPPSPQIGRPLTPPVRLKPRRMADKPIETEPSKPRLFSIQALPPAEAPSLARKTSPLAVKPLQRSQAEPQAMPARPDRKDQTSTRLPQEEITNATGHKEQALSRPVTSLPAKAGQEAARVVHPKPSISLPPAAPRQIAPVLPPQGNSSPLQREASPAEAPATAAPEPAAGSSPGSPSGSAAPLSISVEGNKEQNEAALDEMARQVYEILQRRLQVEFERSHG